jgi:hypothetical protein
MDQACHPGPTTPSPGPAPLERSVSLVQVGHGTKGKGKGWNTDSDVDVRVTQMLKARLRRILPAGRVEKEELRSLVGLVSLALSSPRIALLMQTVTRKSKE